MSGRGDFCGAAGLLVFACLGLAVYLFQADFSQAQEAAAEPSPPPASPTAAAPHLTADPIESHSAIAAALERKGVWDFSEAPLHRVVKSVRASSGIDLLIDVIALEDVGVGTDTPISCHLKDISLQAFLGIVLDELDLAHEIRDGALWITTAEATEGRLSTRMYPVTDLLRNNDEAGEAAYDYDTLIALITTALAPDSWDEVGGPGAIEGIYGALVVSQTDAVHENIARFVTALRQLVRQSNELPQGPGEPIFLGDAASRAKIQAALDRHIKCDFKDVPLAEAIQLLAESSGISIVIDNRSLDDLGVDLETPVSARVKNLPLRFILRRVLDPLYLSWTIHDEVLSITSLTACEERLTVCLYPVADLAARFEGAVREEYDFDTLIELLTSTIEPDSWDSVGGPGTIEPFPLPPALVISQTEANHEKLRALLHDLRRAKQLDQEARATPTDAKSRLTIQLYSLQPGHKPQEVLPLLIKLLGHDILEGEGVVIEALGKDLVIRHDSSGHRRIQGVLSKLGMQFGAVGFGGGMGGMGGGGMGGGGGGFGGGGMGGGGGGFGGGGSF